MEISPAAMVYMNRTAAASVEKIARELGEKITWSPLGKGRTALDQVQECGSVATMAAKILEMQAMPEVDFAQMRAERQQHDTADKAFAYLNECVNRLALAVEAFPVEKWNETIVLPFGPGMERRFSELPMMAYWNMAYHEGQINLLHQMVADWNLPELEAKLQQ